MNIDNVDPLWKLDQTDIICLREAVGISPHIKVNSININKLAIGLCRLREKYALECKDERIENILVSLNKYIDDECHCLEGFPDVEYLFLQLLFPVLIEESKCNAILDYLPPVITNIVVSYMEDPVLYERGDIIYIGTAGGIGDDYRNTGIYILEDEQKLFNYIEEFETDYRETFSIAKTRPNWKRIMPLSYNHNDYGTIPESFMIIRDFPIMHFNDALSYVNTMYGDLSPYEFRFATEEEYKDNMAGTSYFIDEEHKHALIKFTDNKAEYYLVVMSELDVITMETIRSVYFSKPGYYNPVTNNLIHADKDISRSDIIIAGENVSFMFRYNNDIRLVD